MLTRMEEVRAQVAERDELIEIIAIALLTRKNVFILGDTGQAKSAVINLFRAGITGTNQFERLMSKQTDEEALFGRLDLSSLIPRRRAGRRCWRKTSTIRSCAGSWRQNFRPVGRTAQVNSRT